MRLTKAEEKQFREAIQDDENNEWWCTDRGVVEEVFEWLEAWIALGKPDKLTRDEIHEFVRKTKSPEERRLGWGEVRG